MCDGCQVAFSHLKGFHRDTADRFLHVCSLAFDGHRKAAPFHRILPRSRGTMAQRKVLK